MNQQAITKFVWPLIMLVALSGCAKKSATTETTTAPEAETDSSSVVNSVSLTDEAKKAAQPFLAKGSASALFFFADWCPACRAFKPTVEEVEAKSTSVKVVRLNVDEQKDLVKAFKVTSIPSIFFFDKNGQFVEATTGGLTADKLQEEFTKISSVGAVASTEVKPVTEEVKPEAATEEPKKEDVTTKVTKTTTTETKKP